MIEIFENPPIFDVDDGTSLPWSRNQTLVVDSYNDRFVRIDDYINLLAAFKNLSEQVGTLTFGK